MLLHAEFCSAFSLSQLLDQSCGCILLECPSVGSILWSTLPGARVRAMHPASLEIEISTFCGRIENEPA